MSIVSVAVIASVYTGCFFCCFSFFCFVFKFVFHFVHFVSLSSFLSIIVYVSAFQPPMFGIPERIAGLNVAQGNQSLSVFIQPLNSAAEGQYYCSMIVPVSGTTVTVNSEVWNTNGANSTLTVSYSSIIFLFATIMFIIYSKEI